MSVILFSENKFLRVYQSLRLKAKDIAYIWKYPKGWDKLYGLDDYLKIFVEDLYQANIRCWNSQYGDVKLIEKLNFKDVYPVNDYQLLADLRSIRYNIWDNEGNNYNLPETAKKLDKLIEHIAMDIIEKLPEYKQTDWI